MGMTRVLILLSFGVLGILYGDFAKAHDAPPLLLSEQAEELETLNEKVPEPLLNKVISVGVYEEEPFAFRDEKTGVYQGISIDLWEVIAHKNRLSFKYFPVTQGVGIKGVSEKKYDLLLGRIPDFPQKSGMNFQYSVPIYVAGIGVAYLKEGNFGILFNYLVSWDFLIITMALLGCLFLQATIFWVFEHKRNPLYHKGFWKGLGHGLWWSTGIVTSANIDEGETKTFWGRIVAAICMFVSLLAMNILIASIASELTVGKMSSQIQEISDLKRLGGIFCVRGTFGQNLLENRSLSHKVVDSLEEALTALENGKAKAVLYSEPVLRYFLNTHALPDIKFLSAGFGGRYYSFIVQEPSDLLRIINRDILDLMNEEKVVTIVEKYLGKRDI